MIWVVEGESVKFAKRSGIVGGVSLTSQKEMVLRQKYLVEDY